MGRGSTDGFTEKEGGIPHNKTRVVSKKDPSRRLFGESAPESTTPGPPGTLRLINGDQHLAREPVLSTRVAFYGYVWACGRAVVLCD